MFAIVEAGGKQYKVKEKDLLKVELLKEEAGERVQLKSLATFGCGEGIAVRSGSVCAEVVAHTRNDKVIVFKKRRRKNYRRKGGHRQGQTVLRILEVR